MKLATNDFYPDTTPGDLDVCVARRGPKGSHMARWSLAAPPEELHQDFRANRCTEEEYTLRYLTHLRNNREQLLKEYARIVKFAVAKNRRRIVLRCWERDGKFCHRHLLRKWLVENTD